MNTVFDLRQIGLIFAKIFLVHHPVLIDDERLNTRIVVLRWICDIGESAGHLSIDKIRLCLDFGIGALIFQPPEVVAIEGLSDVRLDNATVSEDLRSRQRSP